MIRSHNQDDTLVMKKTSEFDPAELASAQLRMIKMPDAVLYPEERADESFPVDHDGISIHALQDDSEFLGVGATMVEDVVGLDFMDCFRSPITDHLEDDPQSGLSYEYFALGLDFDD